MAADGNGPRRLPRHQRILRKTRRANVKTQDPVAAKDEGPPLPNQPIH